MKFNFNGNDFNTNNFQNIYKGMGNKGHIYAVLITLIVAVIIDYVTFPVYSIKSPSTVMLIAFLLGIFTVLDILLVGKFNKVNKITIFTIIIGVGTSFVFQFLSSEFLNAEKYQKQINMETFTNFSETYPDIKREDIPIVDKDMAEKLGDKKLGEVSALGSQFYINKDYTLVSSGGELYRVSPLEYRDFIKWFKNKENGVPGYIKVNVTDPNDVQLVMLDEGMKYVPSSYLNTNLFRHVRHAYRSELLTDYSFEIDDEGHPYWVVSTYEPEIGLYGGPDATGAIVCDAVTGEMKKYNLDNLPKWVDRVQPVEFAWSQIDNWGYYVNGFVNTIFGQKDMLQTTDGYNYINIDGQTHAFTGMTSIGADRSITGFALINLKTKNAKYYNVGGADEESAMSSAQGQVQNLRYTATFPVLLNIASQPTYFISLKDGEQLVKLYSFVNVTNYNVVGVGETVELAQADYLKKLSSNGQKVDTEGSSTTLKAKVTAIEKVIIDGNTHYYLMLDDKPILYTMSVVNNNELVFTKIGDEVEVKFFQSAKEQKSYGLIEFDNLSYDYKN
ncbi:MAG: CvpA family protein [Erysipelotrichaceae bacterium]